MAEALLEDRVGEIIRVVTFPVERGKIAEFARAMHDPNPVYYDSDQAAAGFADIPAPLTFSVAAAHFAGGDAMELPRALGLALDRLVHGEQRWRYHRPVIAGDLLTGRTRLAAVDCKSVAAGTMTRITIATDYEDRDGQPVLSETSVIIELPAA